MSVVVNFMLSLMRVVSNECDEPIWLQTTQPTSGGAVTADTNCCANCGPDLPFLRQAGHVDRLDGWRCSS